MARSVLMECQVLGMQFVFLNSVIAVMDFVFEVVDGNGDDGTDEEKGRFAFFHPC